MCMSNSQMKISEGRTNISVMRFRRAKYQAMLKGEGPDSAPTDSERLIIVRELLL